MTQDEIMTMARQAGFEGCAELTWEDVICTEELVAFAKLVAQHEREACAEIAFNGCLVPPDGGSPTEAERLMCEDIANAIRARGQA